MATGSCFLAVPAPVPAPKTELELLREIAETTARMLADEHAFDFASKEREKLALYKLLIEWRKQATVRR